MSTVTAPLVIRGLRVKEVVTIAAVLLVMTSIAFAILARFYYLDKLEDTLGDAADEVVWDYVKNLYMWSFAAFSFATTIAITAAVLFPREVGHGLGAAFALAFLGYGLRILAATPLPPLVGILLLAIGALMAACVWASWKKLDRAAWAFLFALAGTLAIVMFFGTPRIKAALEVEQQFYVLILPAGMAAIAVACYRLRTDYA